MKKSKTILLSFSEKNKDVRDLIENRDLSKFKQNTDYICNAIRFYENYKDIDIDNNSTLNEAEIEQVMLKLLKKYKVPIQTTNNNDNSLINNIEKDINDVNIDED